MHNKYNSLSEILYYAYIEECKLRWPPGTVQSNHKPPSMIMSAINHKDIIIFLLKHSLNNFEYDGDYGQQNNSIIKPLANIIEFQYKEIEKYKNEKNMIKSESNNSLLDYEIKQKEKQIINLTNQVEKLKKEIKKKEQIIEKYHST